jgi:CheY-like chemotaxis protein
MRAITAPRFRGAEPATEPTPTTNGKDCTIMSKSTSDEVVRTGGAARRETQRADDAKRPDGAGRPAARRHVSALVLVVDDEADLRELLSEALEDAGYAVAVAENGDAALRAAEREHPALVLTDCTMPGLDGPALVRRLRAQPATRHIPVVAMSATRASREQVGDVPFILKPFDVDELLRVIARQTVALDRADELTASAFA